MCPPDPMTSTGSLTATLRAADGTAILAHHDPPTSSTVDRDLAVVVAHGFTGSWQRPSVRRVASAFSGAGAGVVSLDFRGHGGSGGTSTVGDEEVLDVEAAVAWARELGYTRVSTVGFSMGASIVVRHAGLHPGVAAVVAVSGPSRWYYRGTPAMRRVHWVIERPLGRLLSRVALRTRISPHGWTIVPDPPHVLAARIAPTPLLVVHGDADHYFPVEHGEALYAAAAEPKELWIEPGFGHAEDAATPDLLARIATWVLAHSR
jgi:pimeloyl-ACP methyl ester carboxylesterase